MSEHRKQSQEADVNRFEDFAWLMSSAGAPSAGEHIEVQSSFTNNILHRVLQSDPVVLRTWPSALQDQLDGLHNTEKVRLITRFIDQLFCMFHEKNIDPREHRNRLRDVISYFENDAQIREIILRTLAFDKRLAPTPRLEWELTRDIQTCGDRLHVNLPDLLKLRAQGKPRTVVIPGSGNNTIVDQFSACMRKEDTVVGVCDKLHYPVDQLLFHAIDFDLMRKEEGVFLTEAQQKQLCRYIEKIFVTFENQPGTMRAIYDEKTLAALTQDPESLPHLFRTKSVDLLKRKTVPKDECIADYQYSNLAMHPHVDERPTDPMMQRALQVLVDDHDGKYLTVGPNKKSVYDIIPANAKDLLLGDFTQMRNLQPGADFYAIRSLVFVDNDAYVPLLLEMAALLDDESLVLDDSPRLNFGTYYRVDELIALCKQLAAKEDGTRPPVQVWLIMGRGFGDGEESVEVPISVVMSRSNEAIEQVRSSLKKSDKKEEQSRLCRPEEFKDWEKQAQFYEWQDPRTVHN